MCPQLNRRHFLQTTATSLVSLGTLAAWANRQSLRAALAGTVPRSKVRVGRVYLGNTHPGWPSSTVDLGAEVKQYETEFAKLQGPLADVEFVDGGLVSSDQQLGR